MLELLSPAGSYEAVVAAVQSGADSIYLGFGSHDSRGSAQNFTDEEFETALRYCRARGCGAYVTLNTLFSDDEIDSAVSLAKRACDLGADAIIVQDLGFARILRGAVPDIGLHASVRMSVHNLAGVEAAAELGISRVILASELSVEQLGYIGSRSPIELGILVHGELCASYSGQCHMSALIDRCSANRGRCSGPCRLQYSMGGRNDTYPLSLRDSCLINHLDKIERAGIKCVKIEGRSRRPEYVAIATRLYSNAVKNRKAPAEAELEELREAFSENGFTDGYLTSRPDEEMLGERVESGRIPNRLLADARRLYQNAELRRVPVRFYALIRTGEAARLAAEDIDGNKAVAEGPVPESAGEPPMTQELLTDCLCKTGGTPFQPKDIRHLIDPGLHMPVSAIDDMRKDVLLSLLNERSNPPKRKSGRIPPPGGHKTVIGAPILNIQISDWEQMTPALAQVGAHILYVPLTTLSERFELTRPFLDAGTKIVGVMPRVISGVESTDVRGLLKRARSSGVDEVLLGNMGHIRHGVLEGFRIRGDFGLNAFNSRSLDVLNDAGFESATASFELTLRQIQNLRKPLQLEIIAYGRLPVMLTRHCIIRRSFGSCNCNNKHSLSNRMGAVYPVMRDFQCQNVIYNSKKLFLADRSSGFSDIGLWGIRLLFTTESSRECVMVSKAYLGETGYVPNGLTRGLYYKGVE